MPGARTVRGGFDSHASPPFFLRRIVLSLLGICMLGAQPAGAQESKKHEGPSPTASTLKSMVVPGWGQAANGKWLKGSVFFVAYFGFIGWGISLNQDVQDAKGIGASDAELASLERSRDLKFWFAGFTMLLAMVDAYVDAHLYKFDDRIDADVGYIPLRDGNMLGFRITTPIGLEKQERDRHRP
jgi:hypothetical protein